MWIVCDYRAFVLDTLSPELPTGQGRLEELNQSYSGTRNSPGNFLMHIQGHLSGLVLIVCNCRGIKLWPVGHSQCPEWLWSTDQHPWNWDWHGTCLSTAPSQEIFGKTRQFHSGALKRPGNYQKYCQYCPSCPMWMVCNGLRFMLSPLGPIQCPERLWTFIQKKY